MPALFVSEDFDQTELEYLSHQVFAQQDLLAPVIKAQCQLSNGMRTSELEALLAAMYAPPHGPAYLSLTADAARARCNGDNNDITTALPISTGADDTVVQSALKKLQQARRPVIIAGLETTRSGIAPALRQLVETLNAPALVTYMAKGVIPDTHSCFAGIFTGGAIEQRCVGEADLILLVGLDPVELIRKPWAYSAAVVDIAEILHQPHYVEPEVGVYGAIAPVLQTLADHVVSSDWLPEQIIEHRQRFLSGMAVPETDGLNSADAIHAAHQAFAITHHMTLPRLAVDAGAHMFSALAFWPCYEPLDLLISNGLATMGFSLPAALAAALHDPERGAIAFTGDGGLMMCLGELATAAEQQANITVIVLNDGVLSLIDIKRQERQMPPLGLSWDRPDFAAIATGFGFSAARATDQASLQQALAQATSENGPSLIDIVINPDGYLEQMKALRG